MDLRQCSVWVLSFSADHIHLRIGFLIVDLIKMSWSILAFGPLVSCSISTIHDMRMLVQQPGKLYFTSGTTNCFVSKHTHLNIPSSMAVSYPNHSKSGIKICFSLFPTDRHTFLANPETGRSPPFWFFLRILRISFFAFRTVAVPLASDFFHLPNFSSSKFCIRAIHRIFSDSQVHSLLIFYSLQTSPQRQSDFRA